MSGFREDYTDFTAEHYDINAIDQIIDTREKIAEHETKIRDAARVIADLQDHGSLWQYAEKLRADSNEAMMALMTWVPSPDTLHEVHEYQAVINQWREFCRWVNQMAIRIDEADQEIEMERQGLENG